MNLKTKSQSAVRIRQVSINKYRSNISALALIKTIPFERIKFLLFLAAFLLLLSGCGKPEEEQDSPEQPPKSVPVAVVKPSPFSETITVTGTLFPKTTSVIAAEASGVVREVSAQEGDSVFAGQQVALFFQNTNTAQVDLQSAQTSLQNTQRTLDLTRRQAEENLRSAQIQVDQARTNLENVKKTDTSTGASVEAQIASAQSSVDLARIALENAQKNQSDIEENLNKREKDLQENKSIAITNAFADFRSILTDVDEIMGVNVETRKNNDRFEVYLGFKEPQTKIDAENTFRTLFSNFVDLEEQYVATPGSVSLQQMVDFSGDLQDSLQLIDVMLKKSITGGTFSETELSSFRSVISRSRSSAGAIVANLTAIQQQIEDFGISRPQQTRSAEVALQQSQEQLVQAEKTLQQIMSSGDVSKVGTENQISIAENNLESALSQLEITKKQNELSIEQAIAARDNARNSVQRSSIQASKLSVNSSLAGVVTDVMVDPGETVSVGTPLVTVSQIDTLVFKGEVDARYIRFLQKGDSVQITGDAFDEKTGTVEKIYPAADVNTRRIPVEITLENSDQSIPANIFATATFFAPEEEVLFIPQNALISQNPAEVFVIVEQEKEGNTVLVTAARSVELGRDQDGKIEVLRGLESGEVIIPEPVLGVREGDIVTPPNLKKNEPDPEIDNPAQEEETSDQEPVSEEENEAEESGGTDDDDALSIASFLSKK
jgi:RND family efflux transporter MFP subunit